MADEHHALTEVETVAAVATVANVVAAYDAALKSARVDRGLRWQLVRDFAQVLAAGSQTGGES